MNAKTNWNNQSKTDTVAFSALIATAMLLAWFAAAAPIADPNAALQAAPAMTWFLLRSATSLDEGR